MAGGDCQRSECTRRRGDGSLITLEDVRKRYPESKAGNAYESVWKRFFPDEESNKRLETGR